MSKQNEIAYGMLIDLQKCIGCHACTVACKQEHSLPEGGYNTWVEDWDVGSYPLTIRAHLPKLCNHCEDAPCVSVCPVNATYYAEGGIVVVEQEKCIGCGACVDACPYSARHMNDDSHIAQKCNFCHDRAVSGMQPVCVATCVTSARLFGSIEEIADGLQNDPNAMLAHEKLGLKTHVIYKGLKEVMGEEASSSVYRGGQRAVQKY